MTDNHPKKSFLEETLRQVQEKPFLRTFRDALLAFLNTLDASAPSSKKRMFELTKNGSFNLIWAPEGNLYEMGTATKQPIHPHDVCIVQKTENKHVFMAAIVNRAESKMRALSPPECVISCAHAALEKSIETGTLKGSFLAMWRIAQEAKAEFRRTGTVETVKHAFPTFLLTMTEAQVAELADGCKSHTSVFNVISLKYASELAEKVKMVDEGIPLDPKLRDPTPAKKPLPSIASSSSRKTDPEESAGATIAAPPRKEKVVSEIDAVLGAVSPATEEILSLKAITSEASKRYLAGIPNSKDKDQLATNLGKQQQITASVLKGKAPTPLVERIAAGALQIMAAENKAFVKQMGATKRFMEGKGREKFEVVMGTKENGWIGDSSAKCGEVSERELYMFLAYIGTEVALQVAPIVADATTAHFEKHKNELVEATNKSMVKELAHARQEIEKQGEAVNQISVEFSAQLQKKNAKIAKLKAQLAAANNPKHSKKTKAKPTKKDKGTKRTKEDREEPASRKKQKRALAPPSPSISDEECYDSD